MRKQKSNPRIMVFGTFDGLHEGHRHFFKQAKKLSIKSYLIVSIARDRNVKVIKKALPGLNEKKRMLLVRKSGLADKVVLSGIRNHIPHIVKEKPDIIALGYDQRFYVKNLKNKLKNKGLQTSVVRLKPFKKSIFKNHLLRKRR